MLSPLDFEKIEFENALVGGYKKESVEETFASLRKAYEEVYRENIASKDKVAVLNDLCQKYKAMEDTMQNAILAAQSTGDQIRQHSAEKAELIIKDAEVKAQASMNEAHHEIKKLEAKYEEIKLNMTKFAAHSIGILQSQIELVRELTRSEE